MNEIILLVFVLATLVQLCFWLLLFSKLAFFSTSIPPLKKQKPISIIICARNEAANLKKKLPRILNQNYRSFEIIVVNHHSTDQTASVVKHFSKKYYNLHLVNCKDKRIGKKFALKKGIETAQFDTLLLTDADCLPNSLQWIEIMQKHLYAPHQIALGYGPYKKEKGWLNVFIRYEAVYTAVQYLSFALAGIPYMGVGRNLMYDKSLYEQSNGFNNHEHIASGDDDLFVNAVARSDNTTIVLESDSFVYSKGKQSLRAYFLQKTRHISTSTSYKWYHQVLLGLLAGTHIVHYVYFFYILFKISIIFAVIGYGIRICVVWCLYRLILKKLDELSLLIWIPILDFVFIGYYILLTPVLFIAKKDRWT